MKYLIDKNAAVIPPHENEEACVSVWLCWIQDVNPLYWASWSIWLYISLGLMLHVGILVV